MHQEEEQQQGVGDIQNNHPKNMHSEFETSSEEGGEGSDNENEQNWAMSDFCPSTAPEKPTRTSATASVLQTESKTTTHVMNTVVPKLKPGLTLEDIRVGLGMSGISRPRVTSTKNTDIEPRDRRETCDENVNHNPATIKLLKLCMELFEFTQLLEKNRSETGREWAEKNQVVRQFERLYDSVRDREALFRDKVAEQRKKFQIREGKYFNLKKRARQHLKEWQADRDRYALESQTANGRVQEIETKLIQINAEVAEQKKALLELRNKAKNMPSEKEITDLNLRFRTLQNENAQLLTDRATLRLQLDELAGTLQKRLPTQSTPESLTAVFNTMMLDDIGRFKSPRLEDTRNPHARDLVEIAELEKSADEFQEVIHQQAEAYRAERDELEGQMAEFEEYKQALKAMILSRGGRSQEDEKEETLTQ